MGPMGLMGPMSPMGDNHILDTHFRVPGGLFRTTFFSFINILDTRSASRIRGRHELVGLVGPVGRLGHSGQGLHSFWTLATQILDTA